MQSKLTELQKMELRSKYWKGIPVQQLCKEYEISKTTAYYWISPCRTKQSFADFDKDVLIQKEFSSIQNKLKRMETIIDILEEANCKRNSPIEDRLDEFIRLSPIYGKNIVLEALNISKGTYHNRIVREQKPTYLENRREIISHEIRKIFDESEQCYGSDKIYAILKQRGYSTSKKYVLSIMHELGLNSIRTTAKRDYLAKKRTNIVKRHFRVDESNTVWVSDITQFLVKGIYYYVCIIMDLYSRKVVGYKISTCASTHLVSSTFKAAFASRNKPNNLVFHSDQGSQYTSNTFRKLLDECSVLQSFSGRGTPIDNAVAESFFQNLKREEIYRHDYRSEREFVERVSRYIERYNKERPHRYNNYLSPNLKESNFYERSSGH